MRPSCGAPPLAPVEATCPMPDRSRAESVLTPRLSDARGVPRAVSGISARESLETRRSRAVDCCEGDWMNESTVDSLPRSESNGGTEMLALLPPHPPPPPPPQELRSDAALVDVEDGRAAVRGRAGRARRRRRARSRREHRQQRLQALAPLHERHQIGVHRVRVFEDEAVDRVGHLARVVEDGELAERLGLADAALRVLPPNLLQKLLVGAALAQPALVIQPLQDARHQPKPRGR
eukprot:3933660-Pleurochrysis_carterae.AAC.4